jgi:DNA-binding transcriptional ArsR family regulator
MSIALMTLAWKSALPLSSKMVLLALCDNANDQGECYPSISMLAEKCSMGERTVQQHISNLERDGIVCRIMRSGRSTIYHINYRKICTPADIEPPQNPHPPPAKSAPPPPQIVHKTPADFAPITVNEPSIEPSHKRGGRTAQRKTALSTDWKLPKKMGEWALAEFPHWSVEHIRRISEKFHDHWLSVGGVKKDWEATWRNWCRNEQRAWTSLSRAAPVRGYESEKDKARRAVAQAISGVGGAHGRIIDIGSGTTFGTN